MNAFFKDVWKGFKESFNEVYVKPLQDKGRFFKVAFIVTVIFAVVLAASSFIFGNVSFMASLTLFAVIVFYVMLTIALLLVVFTAIKDCFYSFTNK